MAAAGRPSGGAVSLAVRRHAIFVLSEGQGPLVGPLRSADERATIARREGTQEGAMCKWWWAIFLTLATPAVAEPIEPGDVYVIDGDTINVFHVQPNVRLASALPPGDAATGRLSRRNGRGAS